ncbi:hypothetical protein LOK74_02610 [Brevibacillus humidisoli]|uniref:hypothetical protein n=1 Tax=Brevibacillus humidisoli TaxID=2895522 RepID=UPI001E4BE8F4|nr:hypothetical protein [Brevibacillus humidisoli]UFJ41448.1 hypothetical protein LOK74_02610 [Brevibacillus humidisoli]
MIKKWLIGIALALVGVVSFNLLHNPPEEYVQQELELVLAGQNSPLIPNDVEENASFTFMLEKESQLKWKLIQMGEVEEWSKQAWMKNRERY